jgi:serine/threonine protein kinase
VVAGYTVLRELGRGGAGTVYLAMQDALDRKVALKLLHRDMAEDDVYLQRFFREAKSAAIFSHPNVVAVHDAGEDKATGDYYIAFEFVDGGSLEDLLDSGGKLTETRALEITKAIAQALAFAESKNLIHRDVKPANILITKDGTAKLADLGLAKKTDPEAPKVTVEGLIVGTPYYMAPEQALGRLDIDNRVDIYALGLVLYCMLTGRTPYLETREENSTVIHVLSRRLTEELPSVKDLEGDVSEGTAKLVGGMTARKRESRYRSANDLVRDIDRILTGKQPLGPDGVEPRLSDMPTTSVDAAQLEAAMSNAKPGLEDTLAATRSDSAGSGAGSTDSDTSPLPDAATKAAPEPGVTESGVRRAARMLASSSSAELETIRQRPGVDATRRPLQPSGLTPGLSGAPAHGPHSDRQRRADPRRLTRHVAQPQRVPSTQPQRVPSTQPQRERRPVAAVHRSARRRLRGPHRHAAHRSPPHPR